MKKILVSFSAIVTLLLLVMTVSAANLTENNVIDVEVNGLNWIEFPAVVAGDTIIVRVEFTSDVNASDVTVEVELETDKEDVEVQTRVFDVEDGNKYVKTLKLEVPFDLKDELSDSVTLTVKISGDGFKTTQSEDLRVQRQAYDTQIMSISTKSSIDAGETFSVDVVLKNVGYNDLDDLYVTASIPALNLERTVYFGDLVAVECDDSESTTAVDNYNVDIDRKCNEDDEDTVRGRIFLEVPHNAESGVYTLEVEVRNSDVITNEAKQIFIENAVPETVIKSGNSLIVVNPTNTLKVYSIVPESPATVSDSVIVVPAGSSRQVTVNSNLAGSFSVSVLSGSEVVGTVQFSGVSEDSSATGVVVLTVILAIIFLVLLIVLVVLLTKKPDKEEEFGESYY